MSSRTLRIDEYIAPQRTQYRVIMGYGMMNDDDVLTSQEREENKASEQRIQENLMFFELFNKPSKRKSEDKV